MRIRIRMMGGENGDNDVARHVHVADAPPDSQTKTRIENEFVDSGIVDGVGTISTLLIVAARWLLEVHRIHGSRIRAKFAYVLHVRDSRNRSHRNPLQHKRVVGGRVSGKLESSALQIGICANRVEARHTQKHDGGGTLCIETDSDSQHLLDATELADSGNQSDIVLQKNSSTAKQRNPAREKEKGLANKN